MKGARLDSGTSWVLVGARDSCKGTSGTVALSSLGAWGQLDEVPMWPVLRGATPQLLGALPAVSRAPRLRAHPRVPETPAYLELMALLRGPPFSPPLLSGPFLVLSRWGRLWVFLQPAHRAVRPLLRTSGLSRIFLTYFHTVICLKMWVQEPLQALALASGSC